MVEIRIRQAEVGDAQGLRDLYAMPKAQAGTLQMPYPTLAMWQKRLAERSGYGLVAIVDELLVGDLGLWLEPNPRRRHVAGIGMGSGMTGPAAGWARPCWGGDGSGG